MGFVSTFDKHRIETGKSLDGYLKECRLALGSAIACRHKVYLDTKYWLLLRNNRLGRLNDPVIAKVSALLHKGARDAKLICPISAEVFLEILKQTDPVTLRCSIELIDALSEGVSLLAPQERVRMELLYFALRNMFGDSSCHSPEIFVWTKLAYVLGFMSFYNTPFSLEEELTAQKVFLDQMWQITLTEMVQKIGFESFSEKSRLAHTSGELNTGKFAHADENSSYEETFLSEIAGILEILKPEFVEMISYLHEKFVAKVLSKQEIPASEEAQQLANIVYHGFRLKRFSTELPSLRVPAALHAAIRWETKRKYKQGDAYDIQNATAALPYFDTFLTENSLRHLLTRNDLALDSLYNCTVISDPKRAIPEIEKTISQSGKGEL